MRSLAPRPWIRVIETAMVPRTRVAGWMQVVVDSLQREPIGQRIVETAEDLERTELRDARSGFVAYVPPGSIEQGRILASGGKGSTVPCASCHGANLRGSGNVPGIAGRSPSYLVRQLIDIGSGVRNGHGAGQMRPVVAGLSGDDMIAIAAYLAAQDP